MSARRARAVRRCAVGCAALVVSLAGCGDRPANPSSAAGDPSGTVTVFAAASLTEAFTEIAAGFEAAHAGVRVEVSFGGSSGLARQINQGAPADVFAAASSAAMGMAADAGSVAGRPRVFAANQLVIAVPRGNPRRLDALTDLARPGLKVAMCAEQVPCGSVAAQALSAAGVHLTPVTLEQDVKAALAKLTLGEVDAALVYRTDVRAAGGEVTGIEFDEPVSAITEYPIAVLADAPNPAAGRAFADYVLSGPGQAVLARAGFLAAG